MGLIRTPEDSASRTRDASQKSQINAAMAALEPGALYIMLFYRFGLDNDFHWALYHHIDGSAGGYKFHVTRDDFGGPWTTDNRATGSLDDDGAEPLVGMVRVGNLGVAEKARGVAHGLVQSEDGRINDWEGLMCRVYVGAACERLRKGGCLGYESWGALEDEVHAFGNVQNRTFEKDNGSVLPRPVISSQIAT